MIPPLSSSAVDDWKVFQATAIPSKGIKLPKLLFEMLTNLEEDEEEGDQEEQQHNGTKVNVRRRKLRILEIGCGIGELSLYLQKRGHDITGIDVNHEAIETAKRNCSEGTFVVEDVTEDSTAENEDKNMDYSSYDLAILQLVLSIVGTQKQRLKTIQYATSKLLPQGSLYLSCSGVSDTINPTYAKLYQQDLESTGEMYTYYSRDSVTSKILYTTHHFTIEELHDLLSNKDNNPTDKNGDMLESIHIEQCEEASSRRPNEAAYFLYATAKKKQKQREGSEIVSQRNGHERVL